MTKPNTVDEYLASLPEDRCAALQAIREVILANLSPGFEEGIQYGMIGYYVPHSVYPPGYHCDPKQPLPFIGLASQKNYISLYLMCIYGDGPEATRFKDAWTKTGKKLDMGKACIRIKSINDVPLEVVGATIKRVPAEKYIAVYESNMMSATAKKAASKPAAIKTAAKKTAAPKTTAKVGTKKQPSKPAAIAKKKAVKKVAKKK